MVAAAQWPIDGVPANPKGWLITVATRRWIEIWRSEAARRRREHTAADAAIDRPDVARRRPTGDRDDSLTLLFLCCHPALTLVSQVALTLRAVGGLTTSEIARGLLVPESTVAQRITRAKARIRESGARFTMPDAAAATGATGRRAAGALPGLQRGVHREFRRPACTGSSSARRPSGSPGSCGPRCPARVRWPGCSPSCCSPTPGGRPGRRPPAVSSRCPNRTAADWNRTLIAEGSALLTGTLPTSTMGPYQVQAAIAAVHDEAPSAADTDWPQILGLYDILVTMAPGPMVTLNRIVAVAMVHGPEIGLQALRSRRADTASGSIGSPPSAVTCSISPAIPEQAREQYELAARTTLNLPERTYLESRARRTVDR